MKGGASAGEHFSTDQLMEIGKHMCMVLNLFSKVSTPPQTDSSISAEENKKITYGKRVNPVISRKIANDSDKKVKSQGSIANSIITELQSHKELLFGI